MGTLTHWEGEPVSVWRELWSVPVVEFHDVLGSTNDRARELAGPGAVLPAVVIAEEQRAGRGRSGATWHSPAGAGLWISLALAGTSGATTTLPLRVGVAAASACEAAAPGIRVGIKWPNDLEIHGRKVAGILCERSGDAVIVGVGLNVRQRAPDFPAELAGRATSLETAAGASVSRARVATALVTLLTGTSGPGGDALPVGTLREIAERDVLVGRRVWTQQAGEGVASGIAQDGALLLDTGAGPATRVVAGSVRAL